MKNLLYIVILCVVIGISGCRKRPGKVLNNHDMAMLLADMHRGEGAVEMNRREFSSDSAKLALQEAIYRKHNVTKEIVDSSFSWYGHNMEEYMKVYDEVIEILQHEIDNTDAVAARIQLAAIGDSADTWNFSPRYILNYNSPVPELSVCLYPDENWEKGDNYTLNFKVLNSTSPMKSVLAVEYDDGQVEWVQNDVTDNGKYTFVIITDSTKSLASIYSSILINPSIHETVFIDSLSLMRTRVDRNVYGRRYSQRRLFPKQPKEEVIDIADADSIKNVKK